MKIHIRYKNSSINSLCGKISANLETLNKETFKHFWTIKDDIEITKSNREVMCHNCGKLIGE